MNMQLPKSYQKLIEEEVKRVTGTFPAPNQPFDAGFHSGLIRGINIALDAMPKWVSVGSENMQAGIDYLVWPQNEVARWDGERWHDRYSYYTGVTHYHTLPDPPETDKP